MAWHPRRRGDSLGNPTATIYLADAGVALADLTAEWSRFVATGELDGGKVRPVVAESWRRAREMGLDPFFADPVPRLSGDAFQRKLREHSLLIRDRQALDGYTALKKDRHSFGSTC